MADVGLNPAMLQPSTYTEPLQERLTKVAHTAPRGAGDGADRPTPLCAMVGQSCKGSTNKRRNMLTFIQRIALAWRIVCHKETQLTKHVQRELSRAQKAIKADPSHVGFGAANAVQDAADLCVKELAAVFASQRHGAFSGQYTVNRASKLLGGEPLTPLTGHADEWEPFGPGLWQNKRCRSVFKDSDMAWDHDAVVFRRPDGVVYATPASRLTVQFPYTRKVKYIEVGA